MNRVVIAARLQLVAWPTVLGFPFLILAMSFATNLAIWASMTEQYRAAAGTGGLSSVYIGVPIFYVSSMTQVFPFAIGLGITRRAFYTSMSLIAMVQALAYSLVLTALSRVESATDSWGVDMQFFLPKPIDAESLLAQVAVYAVPFLLLAFVGIFIGLISKRWGTTGIYILGAATTLVGGAAVLALSTGGLLDDLVEAFSSQSTTTLWTLWPLPFVAALAVAGYAGIRRAVP